MKICGDETLYAGKFLALLGAGMVLLGLVVWSWFQATSVGGYWWVLFLGAGTVATVAGEIIKKRMELLVKKSRQARAKATGRPSAGNQQGGL